MLLPRLFVARNACARTRATQLPKRNRRGPLPTRVLRLCSSCAARQPGYVFVECECGELQPLDRTEIRKDHVREVIDGKALTDCERRGLNAVGAFGGEYVRAEQASTSGVGHELDETAHVACGKSARHHVETD